MSGELITEEVKTDNTQVNVRINADTYSRFMSCKKKMHLKGFNLSMTVAINDGIEKAIERAEVWLLDNVHLQDRDIADLQQKKFKKATAVKKGKEV